MPSQSEYLQDVNILVNIIERLTYMTDQTFDDNSSAGLLPPRVPHPTHREGRPVGLVDSTSRRTGGRFLITGAFGEKKLP